MISSTHEMHTLPIERVIAHHEKLKSFFFPRTFDIEPGQFVMLWIPGMDEKPFSVSDVQGDRIEITAKAVGPFSKALMDCAPGTRLGLRGPFGRGFRPRGRGLIVGGGMGIAPLRYLVHRLEETAAPFDIVLGARTSGDLMFADEFEQSGARFATDDGSRGAKGSVLALAEERCKAGEIDLIYGCGPEPMLVALKQLADRYDIDCQLSLERHMKCGIGICGSCCVDGSGICICREGPVHDKAQLNQVADFGLPHRDASGARSSDGRFWLGEERMPR